MSECKVCGRKNPIEDANFCYYCGASLREADANDPVAGQSKDSEYYPKGALGAVRRWIEKDDDETDEEEESGYEAYRRRMLNSEVERSEAESEANGANAKPVISRWKLFGLLLLLVIPVYGWLFLLGWAIVNAVSARTNPGQKEIAHGILMFFATVVVILFLVNAYMNAHPELMEEYRQMYRQMLDQPTGLIRGLLR
ncbi:MAG: zinc ribbon domain-containing protein [Lachnospiraceae bacterium]|nr:zinc ribbon domain-containing protein [Lachnospiraceae bacterium]